MVSEHIYRDFSNHTHHTKRPSEYCRVEIFSFDHPHTKTYHYNNYTFDTENSQKIENRHMTCLASLDDNYYSVIAEYNAVEDGDYRIDILYENLDGDDLVGKYEINDIADDLNFDGEKNILKRKTLFHPFVSGDYSIKFIIPHNCYFIGIIVRKIRKYIGDNLQSIGTNLQFKSATVSTTSISDIVEASFTIGYSQLFDCMLSRTNLYFDYMDEVNLYFQEDGEVGGKVHQRFGGYISSVKINDDKTTLTFSCGDRMLDGEHKYILDSLLILEGTTAESEMSYYDPISFESYGEAIKYLADIFEVTLDTNINKSYLVDGEKYNTGLSISFGKDNDISKVTTVNAEATMNDKSVTLRNTSDGTKKQSITLYEAPKTPVLLRKWEDKDNYENNYLTFHMVYGLGDPKVETKSTVTEKSTDESSGNQSYNKCGVSADGKTIMAIGLPSASKDSKKGFTKAIFERKCPWCGSKELYWGYMWSGNFPCTKRFNNGSAGKYEGHIYCDGCDADYSVQGWEHINGSSKRLKLIGSIVSSSKEEAKKLSSGQMSGSTTDSESVSPTSVLEAIVKIAKGYTYRAGGNAKTYSEMKKRGYGDSRGFSDLIYTELKSYKVSCRIYEDTSSHNAVQYLNANNQWVSFPYTKYDLYPTELNFTSGFSPIGKTPVKEYKGSNIASAKGKSNGSTTTTQTTTTSEGYDKSKPINGFIELTYGYKPTLESETHTVNLNFTQKAGTENDLSGLTNIWVNNATRKTSVDMNNWFDDNEPNKDIYLHTIRFVTEKMQNTDADSNTDWYSFDKSTKDYASCKMDLYQILFDDGMAINPSDLQANGKTVSTVLKEIINSSNYHLDRVYAEHRCDDKFNFSIRDKTKVVYKASEGDNNNILKWSSINCNPVSDLRNKSICVFKQTDGKYAYVDTGDMDSILNYGEKATLKSFSDQLGSKEAYYNARNNADYNPYEIYSYTIVVPYAPIINIEDQIQVVSNNKQLNDIKKVKSIKISYSNAQMPNIRTEIGCDEIEPILRLKKQQEELRNDARSDETWFGRTASPIQDDIYIWEY